MILSSLTFQAQFGRFERLVRDNSEGTFESFAQGIAAREGYKDGIRATALAFMASTTWRSKAIGSGSILKRVIRAIEIDEPSGLRNNLVGWQNRYGHNKRPHRALLDGVADKTAGKQLEQLLYDLFRGQRPDAEVFEALRALVGDRYDLIAYLFFLKDWTRYMPISPTTFDAAFSALGIDLQTARRCSWDNYVHFNEALLAVREALRDLAQWDARLIDAHSFCWMLVTLEPPEAPPLATIPAPRIIDLDGTRVTTRKDPVNEGPFRAIGDQYFMDREAAQRRMGQIAQDVALESEKSRLREAGHKRPDEVVRPVWDEPARGYDILSVEMDGRPRHIEVKSARDSGGTLTFFLSENEARQSRHLPNYFFYLVVNADSPQRDVIQVASPDVPDDSLSPVHFRATLFRRVN